MMTLTTVPLRRLVQSKTNVRRTDRLAELSELVASIGAHGLRQNLNVRPITGGRFEVIAGSRRLLALKRLVREGRLAADHPIPCLMLAANDNPGEVSLVENAIRRPMHPDDQCAAFQVLVERDGLSVEEVAARFGVAPTVVHRRLKLATVSPRLRKLYRKGDLTLDQMMALALVDDHAAQEQAMADLPEWNRCASAIRRALTCSHVPLSHKLAQFVGLQVYEAFGGPIMRDLFADGDHVYLTDAGLLDRLGQDRLQKAATEVRAEGWSWVAIEPNPDYSTRYDRVFPAAPTEGTACYSPEDLARLGARISIGHDGSLQVERGLVRMTAKKVSRRRRGRDEDGAAVPRLPDRVVEELTAHRTAALRVELARRPDLALVAVVHSLTLDVLYPRSIEAGSCLGLTGTHVTLDRHVQDSEDGLAHHELADEHATWLARVPSDPADLWSWCRAESPTILLDLLAFVSALSLNAVQTRIDSPGNLRLQHAEMLADALDLDMTVWWRPSEKGFCKRVPKAVLAEALKEAGREDLDGRIRSLRKPEAAQVAATILAEAAWLPKPLFRQSSQAEAKPSINELDAEAGAG